MPAPMGELGTSAVRVRVPATSANLGPGFDVLGLALAVHNEVEMRLLPEGLQVEVEGEGASELPFDEGNLAYRAAVAGFTSMGWAPPGLGIRLVNRIPLARGMGSSSATIVGSLLAASELARRAKIREIRGLAHRRLLELAVELEGHPDNVVPAAVGGFTICLPGGPGVRYLAFRRRMPLTAVMAVPAFQLSTSKARRALPESVPFQDAVFNVGRSSFLVASLLSGRTALLGVAMEDRLHQPHRAPLVPGLEAALRAAREAGALGAALSGAGPSVIALAPEGETETIRRIAGALADAFKEAGVEAKSYPVELARKGAELIV